VTPLTYNPYDDGVLFCAPYQEGPIAMESTD